MKTHGSRVEYEMINEIDDEPVKTFLLDYYSPKEVNNKETILVGTSNQPDDADEEDE